MPNQVVGAGRGRGRGPRGRGAAHNEVCKKLICSATRCSPESRAGSGERRSRECVPRSSLRSGRRGHATPPEREGTEASRRAFAHCVSLGRSVQSPLLAFPASTMVAISGALTRGRDLCQAFPGVISSGRILEGGPVSIPLYRGDAQGTEVFRKCSKVTLRTLTRLPEP